MKKIIITFSLLMLFTVASAQSWNFLGNPAFSQGNTGFISIKLDSNDIPYVFYIDLASSSKGTVMKYSNNTWQSVGIPGFTEGGIGLLSSTISNNIPYVAFRDNANSFKITVMKYENNIWQTVGTKGFSSNEVTYTSIAIDNNGTPYVSYEENNAGNITVKKLVNGSWQNVGSSPLLYQADSPAISFSNNNTPYLAYSNTGNGKVSVKKFESENWQTVGENSFSTGSGFYFTFAFDSNDVPYLSYIETQSSDIVFRGTVMKFENGTWLPLGQECFTEDQALIIVLALDGNDIPYVSFTDEANSGKATVMKFENSTWQTVGIAGFSASTASETFLAINSSNVPYVAFRDGANNGKVTVMKYDQTAGLNEAFANNLVIYPNPTRNVATISNIPAGSMLQVIDITGKVVYTTQATDIQATVNTSALAGGVYAVKVSLGDKVAVKKLVVER